MLRLITAILLTATVLGATTASSIATTAPAAAQFPRREPSGFGWPLQGPHQVVRPFDAPETAYGPGHRGVDLAATPAVPVLAAGDGLVLYAGALAGRSLVSIEHPGGLRTTYEPITPEVAVGQRVARGREIGRLLPGHPGCAAAAPMTCLHWGARHRLRYLDPLRLAESRHVRLLPWDARASR